jgi:archaellum component FlaD/FlaE
MNYEKMWNTLKERMIKMVNGNYPQLGLAYREMKIIEENERQQEPEVKKALEEKKKMDEEQKKADELHKQKLADRMSQTKKAPKPAGKGKVKMSSDELFSLSKGEDNLDPDTK